MRTSIPGAETSKGLFSLEAAGSAGCCGLALVVVIDGAVHGEVDIDQVPVIASGAERGAAIKRTAQRLWSL